MVFVTVVGVADGVSDFFGCKVEATIEGFDSVGGLIKAIVGTLDVLDDIAETLVDLLLGFLVSSDSDK